MQVNYSFDGNPSSNSSLPFAECYRSTVSIFILTAFSIISILLLFPLFALVLFLSCQRWRQNRSSSFSAAEPSHSDVFTYHMIAMEVLASAECAFYCIAGYFDLSQLMYYSLELFSTSWCVKIQFQMLTCVELYLTVVHPTTYLGLKNTGSVRIRNISIGCVWLLYLVWSFMVPLKNDTVTMVLYFCLVAFSLVVVSFCCVSVLCVLIRPRPGDAVRDKGWVDQSKQRAFRTIATIMSVLWLCLGGMLVCDALESSVLDNSSGCAVLTSAVWFSLPSSLVLPLLFLHRAGKLPCCKY